MLIIDRENKKRKLLYIGILIIILVIILLIKNQYSSFLLANSNYGMQSLIRKGKINNLFIGSSTFRQGIDIDVLEKELDEDSYILSYNGNQPFTEYIQLRKLIENGVDINNLYLDMYLYTLCREPGLDDEKLLMEFDIMEKCELYDMLPNKSFELFWQTFVSSNNEQILTWIVYSPIIDTQFKKGGTLIHNSGMSKEAYENIVPLESEEKINDIQMKSIIRIIGLCRTNDINLVFVETPKAESIMNSSTYIDIMGQYEDFLKDNNIDVIRNNRDGLIYSDFADDIHLSYDGRIKYTKQLTESIRKIKR